jgi:fused signal recognition particle receptor
MAGIWRDKLARTRQALKQRLGDLFRSGRQKEDLLEGLAEALILADVGVGTTEKIIRAVDARTNTAAPYDAVERVLKEEIAGILSRFSPDLSLDASPAVLLAVGVNGGGKTTTLAKLARRFLAEGRSVLLVAADTFRAAAQEQLAIWGRRLGVPVIMGADGADPASVAFESTRRAKAEGFDRVLIDTAGRLHTNANLMNELEKIRRVISREIAGAPHETLLVLDASIGQNALLQARAFQKFSGLTGIALTKLDGTAKGGAVIAIADELRLPIKLVGTGEGPDDLLEFSPEAFVDGLFS